MSRSIRPTPRAREPRTPRQRITDALARTATLHPDEPPERRVVIVRAADLTTVLHDCPPPDQESA